MPKVSSSSRQKNHDDALRYKKNSRRAKEITNSLIEMIAEDVFPISILKGTGFVNFVKVLNDKYELPNEDTLTSTYLPDLFKIKCTKIKKKLSQVETVHFTIDSWKDINGFYFLAVTAHFCIDGTLQRNTLQVSHFSMRDEVKRIQKTVVATENEWEIRSKVKTVVSNCTDTVYNKSWEHILCFGHMLYQAVKKAIKNTTIDDMFDKCTKIVVFLRTSDLLGNQQIGEGFPEIPSLKRRTIDRWSSTYSMLSRMIELRDILTSIFANSSREKNVLDLNENDWNMISGATSVLDPLHWATREMSSDPYVMISNIIPMVFCMEARLKKLKNLQSNVELFRENLLKQLAEYYVNFENNLVYRFATFLDPRYKGTVFRLKNSVEKIKDDLTKTYGNTRNKITSKKKMQTVDNAETEHLWEELPKVQKERVNTEYSSRSFTDDLDSYLKSEVIDRKLNPITWWNTKGKEMIPELVKPALENLCIPALAAPSEHLCSNMGQIILDRRIPLQPKYVNMLAVVGWN